MAITLTATDGPHKGKVFTFAEHDTLLVGRSKNAHFQLPKKDMYFSRIHFMVEVNPPSCRILDMGSRNGTYVNGNRITAADLVDGDEIKAGHTILRVALQGQADPFATRPPEVEDADVTSLLENTLVANAGEPPQPPTSVMHEALTPELERAAASASKPVASALAPKWSPQPRRLQPVKQAGRRTCAACEIGIAATQVFLCPACEKSADGQPQLIPGHRIVRELGRGATGVVFLAIQEDDGKVSAIKTIKPAVTAGPGQMERFLREADILRRLQSRFIVPFRAIGEADGQLFFIMDYVPGTNAKQLLREHGLLDVRMGVRIICQVLRALSHAHARGFVHRDVKPANILIGMEKGRRFIKVADFGLARVYNASNLSGLTFTGQFGGTFHYMPPEQVTHYRDVQPAADQYSAAATLYHLLTGKFIHDLPHDLVGSIKVILEDEPVPIKSRKGDIPDEVAAAIHRALARSPEDRFPGAEAFRQAIAHFGR